MVLSSRARKLIKWVGYPLFALLCFIVSVYVTFPYQRLKAVIEDHASASGEMQVSIGDVGPSPLLGLTLSDVRITITPPAPRPLPRAFGTAAGLGGAAATEPTTPEPPPKPQRLTLERVTVKTGLLALISGGIDVSFAIVGLGGEIEGSYSASKSGWTADVEVQQVKLHYVPQVAAAVGLPVRGELSGKAQLAVPLNRWDNATGNVELSCEGCSVGDGKAKLKVPGNPMLAMGISMPRIRLGQLAGKVVVEKGVATFEDVSAKSPDIELHLEGTVSLRQPVVFSSVNGYLRFRISPELKRRDAKFELLENGLSNAKRSDGFYGMMLSGTVKNLRPFPSAIGPAGGGAPRPGRAPLRPMRRSGAGGFGSRSVTAAASRS